MPGRYARILFAAALTGVVSSFATAPDAAGRDRTLSFYFPHTGERGSFTFKRNGRFDRGALKRINHFLRDWRRNEATDIDPALLDLVWEVHRLTGSKQPITVVSAYRSPATNEKLRKRGRGVAKNSQHTHGKAMDFFIPGVSLAKLREIGLKMQAGGVGFYPTSGSPFVHLDTGSVRHWPRMSRKQLMAVFPTGETVHVPTDGKPLPGYQLAKVKVDKNRRRGVVAYTDPSARTTNRPRSQAARDDGRTRVAALAADKARNDGQRNWLGRVFGDDEDEDDESEAAQVVASSGPPMDLVEDAAPEAVPLPRQRPASLSPPADDEPPVVVASLEGLPRPRPSSTPFDITPEERERMGELAAMPPVGGRAGSRRTDDALSSLYKTASFDPGEDAIRLAREQLARMAAETTAQGGDAGEPSGDVDDALAGLFATANDNQPQTALVVDASAVAAVDPATPGLEPAATLQPAVVTRVQKGDLIQSASLAPLRAASTFGARRSEHSIFRAREDETADGAPPRDEGFVPSEPRSALSAAAAVARPGSAEQPPKSVIRLAYADPAQADPTKEPVPSGSVFSDMRPRLVPRVAAVDPSQPLVAAGLAEDDADQPADVEAGPVGPLPRARPWREVDAPRIVASLPRDALRAPVAGSDRGARLADPSTVKPGAGEGVVPDDAALLAAKIERGAEPAVRAWSEDSRRIAGLAERMMAGDTQFQARGFADLRRPTATNMRPLFTPAVQTPAAAGGTQAEGWQRQSASLDTSSFQPIPRPEAEAPTPRGRPQRAVAATRVQPAQDSNIPKALSRLIRTARSFLQ